MKEMMRTKITVLKWTFVKKLHRIGSKQGRGMTYLLNTVP